MDSNLIRLLDIILKKYIFNTYCLVILTEKPLNIINDLPMMTYNHLTSGNMSSFILDTFDMGCSDYIIYLKSPKNFIEIYDENIHVTNQRRSNRKLIFLPYSHDEETRKDMLELIKNRALSHVPDVLFILPNSEESNSIKYDLGTHKYVGLSGNDELFLLDTWSSDGESFKNNADLFPDKLSNMLGRIVKVATFSYKPYAILELDENDNIIKLDGTEMKAFIEYCRWSNCTIEIVRDDEHEWGEIWDNRTGNGILGNIVQDDADVGYAALYSWYHEYMFLDLSMPIVRTGITCIAPAPNLVARWLLPILPFNFLMWISVLLSIIIGSVGFFVTSRFTENKFSVINAVIATVGIIVAQIPPIRNLNSALRQVLSWLLLLSLVLSNVYSSGLASVVTVPKYEDPIDSVQDLVDSNLNWGATHDAWIFSILLSTDPNIVHLVEKFKKWPSNLLKSHGKTRDFAYSVERLPAGHYAIGEYVTKETVRYLKLMSEDIYWEQCVIMARKSSPFTRSINKFLGRLHQSGLLHIWETQVVLKHSNYAVQQAVKLSQHSHGDGSNPSPLEISHVQGPLYLLIFGEIVAAIVFLFECCIYRINKSKLNY